jgi:hypothetical protein
MNSAVDDPGSPLAGHSADFIAAKSIPRVNADADDISGLNALGHNLFQGFVDQNGIPNGKWRRCCEHKQPSGGNDGSTKGVVARIYEMNAHETNLSSYEFGVSEGSTV